MPNSSQGFAAIPWYRRIQVQVALGVSLLAGCSMLLILTGASVLVTRQSMTLGKQRFETARTAFYRLVETRTEFAAARLRLVTQLPVFRAYISDPRLTGDRPTMEVMTEDYRSQLGARFLILTRPDGQWSVAPGWPGSERDQSTLAAGIDTAREGRGSHGIVSVGDELFLVVSEPAMFAQEVLGTLTVGYQLDTVFAQGLADVTDSEVIFVADGRVTAGSLAQTDLEQLRPQLTGLTDSPIGISLSPDASQIAYIAGEYPLEAGMPESGNRLVLLQNWEPTQLFLDSIRKQMLAIGAVVLVAALSFAILFGIRVTRPLRLVAEAADEISKGHWRGEFDIEGGEEAAVMARAFHRMTVRLRESHDSLQQRTRVLESEIVERKRAEEQLLISNAAAEQANTAKSAFLANMSHELRTPLHAILGYAEILKEDAEQDGNAATVKDLNRIHRSSKDLLKLIDNVLDVANVDSGQIELRPDEVDLSVLVDDLVRTATPRVERNSNRLTVAVDGECRDIWADAGRLRQILLHLLDNAAKFTDHGEVTLRVRAAEYDGEPSVEFSVQDSGIGIQAEHLSQLFVSFRQLDTSASRKYGGAGLGLALSRTLARSMGGDVHVESVFGEGSKFTLSLPVRAPAVAEEQANSQLIEA